MHSHNRAQRKAQHVTPSEAREGMSNAEHRSSDRRLDEDARRSRRTCFCVSRAGRAGPEPELPAGRLP
eukprot:8941803-Lingulodinium_polyedra.AAC.1